jgi:hypothetical protein
MRSLALLCLAVCPAAANDLAGPSLGLVFDAERGLLPIRGTAGAATFGDPLDAGGRLLATGPDYAIAASEDGIHITGGAERVPIPVPAADLVALSPSGSAAAFYDRGESLIRVVTGLPREANPVREIFAPGVTALAVSDDGAAVAASLEEGVAVFEPESTRILTAPARAAAIAFLPGTRDFLAGDKEIYLVKADETLLLAAEAAPIALAASRDGKRAFAVNEGASDLLAIDIAAGSLTTVACPCEPRSLAPLAGNAVFRLTDPSSGLVWMLDADRDEPAALFVPRPAAPEVEAE